MSDWTCDKVGDWIDLHAAGEADGPTRAVVDRHLKACPSCAELQRQSQQLIGLLDQRMQESERLGRLWSRLESPPRLARRPAPLRLWRAAALAASVLLTFGLFARPGPGSPDGVQTTAVLRPPAARFTPGQAEAMAAPGGVMMKEMDAAREAVHYPLDLKGKDSGAFRRDILEAQRTGGLPPPPDVNLDVTIRNPGQEEWTLRFGEKGTDLTMDLRGPGALDVPAPHAPAPLAGLGAVRVPPGESRLAPIRQLAYGPAGAVHYLYWTEPGEYTLTVMLHARLWTDPLAGPREISQAVGTFKIQVDRKP